MKMIMEDPQREPARERRYPERYEKMIPIALGVIVVAIGVILVFTVAIALRLLPGVSY